MGDVVVESEALKEQVRVKMADPGEFVQVGYAVVELTLVGPVAQVMQSPVSGRPEISPVLRAARMEASQTVGMALVLQVLFLFSWFWVP